MSSTDVTVVNNSGQTVRLRFPEGSEMPAYLKSLARREELQEVTITATDDSKPSPTVKASRGKRGKSAPESAPTGDDAGTVEG